MDVFSQEPVAVFLDFENLAVSARAALPSERLPLDVTAIVDFAQTKGSVFIKRAYANWGMPFFRAYETLLLQCGFELMYTPQTSSQGKNGSDVKMAVDVMLELTRHPEIRTFIIGSGDTDFIPLLQAVRAQCKSAIVVGFSDSVGRLVKANATEFQPCDDMVFSSAASAASTSAVASLAAASNTATTPAAAAAVRLTSLAVIGNTSMVAATRGELRSVAVGTGGEDAQANVQPTAETGAQNPLVRPTELKATATARPAVASARVSAVTMERVRSLMARYFRAHGGDATAQVLLKPRLKKLDPSFSERELGFPTFKEFVECLRPEIAQRLTRDPNGHTIIVWRPDCESLADMWRRSGELQRPDVADKNQARQFLTKKSFSRTPAQRLAIAQAMINAFMRERRAFTHAELIDSTLAAIPSGANVSKSHVRLFETTLWGADCFDIAPQVEGEEHWTGTHIALKPEYSDNADVLVQVYLNRLRFVLADKYPSLTDTDFDELFGTTHLVGSDGATTARWQSVGLLKFQEPLAEDVATPVGEPARGPGDSKHEIGVAEDQTADPSLDAARNDVAVVGGSTENLFVEVDKVLDSDDAIDS